MPRTTTTAHEIHFVKTLATGDVSMYATQYLPYTNTRSSRFAFWRTNFGLEEMEGSKKIVSYDNLHGNNHERQLQAALGPDYKVLPSYDVYHHLKTL